MKPELSIVTVLYNSQDCLAECLRSVQPVLAAGWAELIAVDNASPDRSVDILRRELPDAKMLQLPRNRGFAGGVNAGLAVATGRYWLLLNPDVRVPPEALEHLVGWMDLHPDVGVATPNIVSADGRWESPGRAAPSIGRTVLEISRVHRLMPRALRGRILRGPYWNGGDQTDAGWVPGTAMIVRPIAVRDVGPLREDMFMYGEDVEWCWRMRQVGWHVGVCSGVVVEHTTSASAQATFGVEEKEQRIASGIDAACRVMYGRRHARALAAVTAASLWVESRSPGRRPEQRARSRAAARRWQQLASRR